MSLAKALSPLAKLPPSDIIHSDELWSDEPQLETPLHLEQIILLLTCLKWWWRERRDFFASGNISIYYEKQHVKKKPHKFRGPDFFVVLDVQPKERKSWVVWEEDNRFPNLIIEILSGKTAKTDRTTKKLLYQDTFKTPEYFWFHPYTLEFSGFRLVQGIYQPLVANNRGWRWSEELGLFLGIHDRQLRYFTREGELVPVLHEQVDVLSEQVDVLSEQVDVLHEQVDVLHEQVDVLHEQVDAERQQRELAQQQVDAERQQRELAQQQRSEMETLLDLYRERFGELPKS
jgi:Uma2 family endonuclease/regulator of replication initiation timing